MLECYKDGQPLFYSIARNAIFNNRVSHAYIFDSNGNPLAMKMVMDFVKEIVCMDLDDDKSRENICKRIDDGNYVDVKIIKSDGMWIKKEQLLDLQSEFNNKAFEGKKKIYIIRSAEKMNTQTANSILKFLEEPVDDIIAILIVNNMNLLLPTIISRCQVIKLNSKNYSSDVVVNLSDILSLYDINDISADDKIKFIDDVITFIRSIEFSGLDTLIYTKKLWHDKFKNRNLYIVAIDLMINFYYDVIRCKCGLNILFFGNYFEFIKEIADMNEVVVMCNKINYLIDSKNGVRYNLNVNLLIDKLIIDMCGDM